MRIAMLSPIAWRTPPEHYGPWESMVSLLTEGLVARGVDVTLFATRNSKTSAKLRSVCPRGHEEDRSILPKVWESLHISELFESGDEFDLIHNHFDYLPLTYSAMTSTPVLTTIHGFSSPEILPVYKKYDGRAHYVSISNADRSPELTYLATIHHGIDLGRFTLKTDPGDYLLFFGRIHHDKGAREAIAIARQARRRLIIAGIIQDEEYFEREVKPHIDDDRVVYVGSAGPEKRDELLGGAYALLHPINFDEPFGLSVVEAMACGTPVVATGRGSMPEVVQHGTTGYLVSSIEEAVGTIPAVREIDRRACRAWVEERFSVDRMVDDYIRAYEHVLAAHPRASRGAWGYQEVLSDAAQHRVKKIVIHPGQDLSLQLRHHQAACWIIVQGQALATLDARDIAMGEGRSLEIPRGAKRQIRNVGEETLVLLEVQGEKDKVA